MLIVINQNDDPIINIETKRGTLSVMRSYDGEGLSIRNMDNSRPVFETQTIPSVASITVKVQK